MVESYPAFKKGCFSNEYILRMCNRIEKRCYRSGIDKKLVLCRVIERLIDRKLTRTENDILGATVDFLHRSKLIRAAPLAKLWHRVCSFFR